MVNRCMITSERLAPPLPPLPRVSPASLRRRITGMSFEQRRTGREFQEQEDIDAWLESMKKGARYTVGIIKKTSPSL